ILSLTIFFPIYVHYQGEYKVILSEVIFTTLGKLPITILNLILCGLWGGILFYFPVLIFFFCISILALIITLIFQHCFKRRSYTLNINLNGVKCNGKNETIRDNKYYDIFVFCFECMSEQGYI